MILDIVKIIAAVVMAYAVFVFAFYFLAKLIFPKIENDELNEASFIHYRKIRLQKRVVRKVNPKSFKVSRTVYPAMS